MYGTSGFVNDVMLVHIGNFGIHMRGEYGVCSKGLTNGNGENWGEL